MHLISGGRHMGKKAFAQKLYGGFKNICDLKNNYELFNADLIINFHDGVKNLMLKNIDPINYFCERLNLLEHSVIIGDDISCGVVPVDEFERRWRDNTGYLYQVLAERAERVDYIWAGLNFKLKG